MSSMNRSGPAALDYYAKTVTPTLQELIADGRDRMQETLKNPSGRNTVENHVQFICECDRGRETLDTFVVTLKSGQPQFSPEELASFLKIGCEVASTNGRHATLRYSHKNYDTRNIAVDMSGQKKALAGIGFLLAIFFLGAGALATLLFQGHIKQ